MRTGYCGSLTTFASWQLELVVLAVQGHKVCTQHPPPSPTHPKFSSPEPPHSAALATQTLLREPPAAVWRGGRYGRLQALRLLAVLAEPRRRLAGAARSPRPPSSLLQAPLSVVAMLQWVEAAMGYLAGIFASIACYMLGMHAALAIDRCARGGPVRGQFAA